MNKLLPFALALALALPGCAAGDTAPQPPETPTTTTETAAEAPAESTLPGLAGRLRQTSYDTAAVGQTFYGMMSTYDDETLTSVYTIIATDTAANTQQKAAELETQGYYTSLAAWQDGLELYIDDWLDENGQPVTNSYQNGDITSWRYKIDPATAYTVCGSVDGRWLLVRVSSPSPMPDPTSEKDAFDATWQNSTAEIILYEPTSGEMEKLYEFSTTGDSYDYCGQRDGSLYFIHWQTNGNGIGDTAPATVEKLENGAMTPVWTLPFSSISVSTVQQQGELRWVTQLTEKGETAIKIYDLADGQTYTRAIEWDKVEGWNAGYPEKLLANDKILVSNGSYTNVYGIDRKAYAVMDCAAYLAGSTDYTPIAMYTGD